MTRTISDGTCATAIFITGVGRSGTHFMAELFRGHDGVDAYHLDDLDRATADSFWMYTKWYGLSVDPTPFIRKRLELIRDAATRDQVYCESNPYIALAIGDLCGSIKSSHIVVVRRDPRKVVLSHLNKGWYSEFDSDFHCREWKAPGYNYQFERPNHFFGRIMPTDEDEYEQWKELSQVGKIAWMWRTINSRIDTALRDREKRNYTVIEIDDFNYGAYVQLSKRLGLRKPISQREFSSLARSRPGKTSRVEYRGWGKREEEELREQVALYEAERYRRA